MYNKVIMVGNLTRDIDFKILQNNTALAKSAIATSYKYKSSTSEQKEETCFLEFTIFGRVAEIANQYLKKGSRVMLEGRLVLEQWVGQDGQNRSRHTLHVSEMKMLGRKSDETMQSQPNYQPTEQNIPTIKKSSNIPEIDIDEDEIPF